MTYRSTLVAWHRWIGLAFGAFLLIQGLSGATMVFRDELNLALHRDALRVSPSSDMLPIQTLLDIARSAHPQLYVERIEYPRHRDEAFLFRLESQGGAHLRYLAIDPYRGTITRDAPASAWPAQWLFRLHHQLLAGHRGETIIGIVGLALLFLALSAPFVWWPGRHNLRRGFTVKLGASPYRAARDLHRVGGILVALFLLVWATTGALVVWKSEVLGTLAKVTATASKPVTAVAERADAAFLPIDEIVAAARERYGQARIKNVRFPGGHGRAVAVFFEATSTTRPRASDQIWLDRYTARTLGVYEAGTVPASNQFLDWMLPIHTGEAFGLPGRVLFLLVALCLPALAVTGLWQWLARRRLNALPPVPPRSIAVARQQLLEVTVARAWDETGKVRALELRAVDGGELPAFEAGAHVDLYLPNDIVRQYSIWSDPLDRSRYCIGVLGQDGSRGGSLAVHALRAGTRLQIGTPRNTFALVENAPAFLLVAGGIGVTPILAMARRLKASGRPFVVHYCARRREEAAFLAQLQELVPNDSLVLHFGDEPHPGRFEARAALSVAAQGAHVYVCGPARLIEAVLTAGRALGWAPDRLHSELFQAALPDVDSQAFDIRLRSGRIVHVPAQRTALEALAAQGIHVPSSCGVGICGTCLTGVLDGIPDHRDRYLTPAERDRNDAFTPCCSRARTPVLVVNL